MRCSNIRYVKVMGRLGSCNQGGSSFVPVPCGKCEQCLHQKRLDIFTRLVFESERPCWNQMLFVTITIDPDHCDGSLHKDDLRVYLKTLRNRFNAAYAVKDSNGNIIEPFHWKYYACGEYGELRNRPHYHLMLYLQSSVDWSIIQKANKLGVVCDILPFVVGRAWYIAKYSVKAVGDDDYFKRKGVEQPFHFASKGLGDCFLDSKLAKRMKSEKTYLFRDSSGRSHTLPSYLRDKLFSLFERYEISDFYERYDVPSYLINKDNRRIDNQRLRAHRREVAIQKSLKNTLL